MPTAYQIALAEVDPVYAMRMREDPAAMASQQAAHNAAFGGARTEREAEHDMSGRIEKQMAADPRIQAAILTEGQLAWRSSSAPRA